MSDFHTLVMLYWGAAAATGLTVGFVLGFQYHRHVVAVENARLRRAAHDRHTASINQLNDSAIAKQVTKYTPCPMPAPPRSRDVTNDVW